MILTRATSLVTVSLFCLVAMPASGAMGATKKKAKAPVQPTVSSVAPLTLGVGDMLTIKGKNFVAGKNKNTVLFKSAGNPAVAVKAAESTSTRMKVIVPRTLVKYFAVTEGAPQPTKFSLRILAKRFGKSFTSAAMSPTIGPANVAADGGTGGKSPAPGAGSAPGAAAGAAPGAAALTPPPPPDCDGDGILDSVDGDDDNDNLSDALEASLNTDRCAKDTDLDGNEDAFEYYSALDLNNTGYPPLPYPGKRPYPNPLDPSDGATDYDGDGLRGFQEHALWQTFGAHALPLNFSDGTKFTGPPVAAPTAPSLAHLNIVTSRDSSRELAELSDDEKDSDGDRLGNWDESRGRMHPGFWPANYPAESQFSPFYMHMDTPMYLQPDYLDADSDGDGVLDGDDDQDHDGLNNVAELIRGPYMVHPYNPCLPDYHSATCPRYISEGDTVWAPLDQSPLPPNPVPWT